MDDQIERGEEVTKLAVSRIPEGGVEKMNINSYIASLTNMIHHPLPTDPEDQQSLERTVGMFSYLRDNQNSQTVGEAWKSIEERKIDPKVVKLWVEEGMAVNPGEYDAILKGYPELKIDLERVRKEKLDRILGKK